MQVFDFSCIDGLLTNEKKWCNVYEHINETRQARVWYNIQGKHFIQTRLSLPKVYYIQVQSGADVTAEKTHNYYMTFHGWQQQKKNC